MKGYFFGFSHWKRNQVSYFFPDTAIVFCSTVKELRYTGIASNDYICIWGKKLFFEVELYAKEHNMALYRVEDGFIRSVSLGSDLTKAYSLVVDGKGIYFDSTQTCDLEYILNHYTFDNALLLRAKKLQKYLIKNKISKYNSHKDVHMHLDGIRDDQIIIMVPGQVEDDASLLYGAEGMTNLELLQKTRLNKPKGYIIYKPHPDVTAGNRPGNILPNIAMQYCNSIIADVSLDSVLSLVDEVHTMTSLVGLEALIRGKIVYTYGLPFYAGWGLTIDSKTCKRRTAIRTLDELVAATYIIYPRYIHPKTNKFCEVESLVKAIDAQRKYNLNNIFYRVSKDIRNYTFRIIRRILVVLKDKS